LREREAMPFYEYECPACKYYTEVLQKISDKPLAKCPSCGKKGFKRLMSAPVFRLKGSGWYETDFKSGQDNQRNLAGAERDEAKPAVEEKGGQSAGRTPAQAPASKSESAARPTPTSRGARRAGAKPAPAPARAAAKRRAQGAPRRAVRRGRRR